MDAVTQDKYDYTNCSLVHAAAPTTTSTTAPARPTTTASSRWTPAATCSPTPTGPSRPCGRPTDFYNFGPRNYLQRPDERYTLGGFAHYEINPMFDVYTDVMFSDDHTLAQIAPSGLFLGSGTNNGAVNINCDNPLMSAQQGRPARLRHRSLGATDNATLLIGRRNIEGGPRIDDLRHTAYRIDLGSRGDLGSGWSYDVYGQYGLTLYSENYSNELSKQRVPERPASRSPTPLGRQPGQPICKVALSGQDPTCVPLDVFGGLGAFTPGHAELRPGPRLPVRLHRRAGGVGFDHRRPRPVRLQVPDGHRRRRHRARRRISP